MRFFDRLIKLGPRGETGAIAVVSAIVIVALIGLLALSVDIGKSYYYRAQAQAAADAGALAGMQEKLKGATNAEILAKANEYAILNDLDGHQGTPIALAMEFGGPGTVIGSDFVQIEVTKHADYFFAPIFNLIAAGDYSGGTVRARALARRVFLTGLYNIMPWGVMDIKTEGPINALGDDWTRNLGEGPVDTWTTTLPLPDDDDNAEMIDLDIVNGQGYHVTLDAVASIWGHDDDDKLTDAWLDQHTVNEGGSTTLYVRVPSGATKDPSSVKLDGKNIGGLFDEGGGLYSKSINAPSEVDGSMEMLPIDVSFGGGDVYLDVAVLVVRMETNPVLDIMISNAHLPEDSGSSPTISVTFQDLDKDIPYDLKVASDGTAGNFQALDLSDVTHKDGTEHGVGGPGGADYFDNLLAYPGVIDIGDIIATKTGVMSGAQTENQLDERFSSCLFTTYEAWDVDRPGCSRVVVVPIVEQIERITGKIDVKVIQLGAFFITEYGGSGSGTNIRGRFIDYAKPGEYTTTPPDSDIYLETSRLEMPGY